MKKGAEKIIATSPHGAATVIQGVALQVARGHSGDTYRILECGRPEVQDHFLVGLIPISWIVELVPNQ